MGEMEVFDPEILVTRPILPRFADLEVGFRQVLASGILTNLGPHHEELEGKLQNLSGAQHLSLWNNGTIALVAGLSQLDLTGEVIVTPFTFPATVHVLKFLGLKPVFVDIKRNDWTIDPTAVEHALTPDTSAILGTHIYGNLCDHESLWEISRRAGVRLVFDGAHLMGRDMPWFPESESLIGDFTMLSFHATKVFHTVEGGALVTNSPDLDRRFREARNFAIQGEDRVSGIGINGKLSEFHSVVGLATLPLVEGELMRRRELANLYWQILGSAEGLTLLSGRGQEAQYLAVRIESVGRNACRDCVWKGLRHDGIRARRYFYPLMSQVAPYDVESSRHHLPNAELAVKQCLVLPLHGGLSPDLVARIANLVLERLKDGCDC
jgi:dTDP-4-amino-4,6-dideoxygalactose transaminase